MGQRRSFGVNAIVWSVVSCVLPLDKGVRYLEYLFVGTWD